MVMTDLHPNLGSEGGGFFEVHDKGIMSKYLDITECRSFFSFLFVGNTLHWIQMKEIVKIHNETVHKFVQTYQRITK